MLFLSKINQVQAVCNYSVHLETLCWLSSIQLALVHQLDLEGLIDGFQAIVIIAVNVELLARAAQREAQCGAASRLTRIGLPHIWLDH